MNVVEREQLQAAIAETMHNAYEAAAVGNGWETNLRSRVSWAELPEANRATMLAAVEAALDGPLAPLVDVYDAAKAWADAIRRVDELMNGPWFPGFGEQFAAACQADDGGAALRAAVGVVSEADG